MQDFSISKCYIHEPVANYKITTEIISKLKIPYEIVQDPIQVYQEVLAAKDPVQKGKESLFLVKNRGSFIKNCPGTRNYLCCGYKILHIGTFCCMDCSYCILQSYFHPPVLQFYVNYDDLSAELNHFLSLKNNYRIGTGEFTDSLIWEQFTELSNFLIPKFAKQTHAVLELKTKTVSIDKLKFLNHNRKTIVSWSLNSEKIIKTEERLTASLSDRLAAAAKCQSWGYPLAFHFDPLILYDNCIKDYKQVIDLLFSYVEPENIVWISLGSFRFMPSLKSIIQKRFTDSKIVYGEFITGLDGKMRYFKPLRIELYKKIISHIKKIAPETLVYFCMEDQEVWQKTFGFEPSESGGLTQMLNRAAAFHCGLE